MSCPCFIVQVEGLGIDSIARLFTDFGYERRDVLHFPGKKLRAYWFSPPQGATGSALPRAFISEIKVLGPKTLFEHVFTSTCADLNQDARSNGHHVVTFTSVRLGP